MTDPKKHDTDGKTALGLRRAGFRELVGYDLAEWREGYAEIILSLRNDHGNRMGITHGGVYMTIMDAAMGHAATWCSVPGNRRRCVTISMTTTFMQPAASPVIRAVGTLISVDRRVATCRAQVVGEDGAVLVAGQGSFRYGRGSDRVEGIRPDDVQPLR